MLSVRAPAGTPAFDPPVPFTRDPRKLIVCLQFWEGDSAQAMRLARLIADIEPVKNDKVDFAFAARFDTAPDPQTVAHVSRKFNVWTLTGTRREVGWPEGCNALACDMFQQAIRFKRAGKWNNHKGVYLLEGDNMPMHRNWLQALSDEWDEAQSKGKLVMGSWSPFHTPVGHINGNLIFDLELAIKVRGLEGVPQGRSWDCEFVPKFAPVWHKSRQMQSHYEHHYHIPREVLFSSVDGVTPVAVVHGVKDLSAEKLVRPHLFPAAK